MLQAGYCGHGTDMTTLLRTKLHMPPVSVDLIHRRHLIERLNHGLNRSSRVTLISAPAGYGKTTLAAAWLQDSSHPVAWLSLDEQDSDVVVFLTTLSPPFGPYFPKPVPKRRVYAEHRSYHRSTSSRPRSSMKLPIFAKASSWCWMIITPFKTRPFTRF